MTLNELRSLFRMLSRTSRNSNPSSPTSPTQRAPPTSDGRSVLCPNINYIPISEATSRSQSSASMATTMDELSNAASPNGPSRIPTICEALNELDDEQELETIPKKETIVDRGILYWIPVTFVPYILLIFFQDVGHYIYHKFLPSFNSVVCIFFFLSN